MKNMRILVVALGLAAGVGACDLYYDDPGTTNKGPHVAHPYGVDAPPPYPDASTYDASYWDGGYYPDAVAHDGGCGGGPDASISLDAHKPPVDAPYLPDAFAAH
jgi:hypothetical protein